MNVRVVTDLYSKSVIDEVMTKVYSALMFQGLETTVRLSILGDIVIDLVPLEREKIVVLLTQEFKGACTNSPVRST